MYTTDFEFDGSKLSEYGFIVCSFDGSTNIETVSVGADINFTQVSYQNGKVFDVYDSKHEQPYTTTFQICKNPCLTDGKQDSMTLSVAEASLIQKWLCRKEYKILKILDNPLQNVYWEGLFVSKQILFNKSVVGLELTFTSNASFSHVNKIVNTYACTSGESFTLTDISDEEGYIYPDIEIKMLSSGDFSLENSLDDKQMEIKNCENGEIITIKGELQAITTTSSTHKIARDFNYICPRIVNSFYDANNVFTPSLDCTITITYSPIIKVGTYEYRDTNDEPIVPSNPDTNPDEPDTNPDTDKPEESCGSVIDIFSSKTCGASFNNLYMNIEFIEKVVI